MRLSRHQLLSCGVGQADSDILKQHQRVNEEEIPAVRCLFDPLEHLFLVLEEPVERIDLELRPVQRGSVLADPTGFVRRFRRWEVTSPLIEAARSLRRTERSGRCLLRYTLHRP
jgi:hypothetical protein